MPIGNIQGYNPYTTQNTTQTDPSTLGSQNREAARTELNEESTRVVQQAFEVEITTEARERQAAEEVVAVETEETTAETVEETPPPPAPEAPQAPQQAAPEASQIINIVA